MTYTDEAIEAALDAVPGFKGWRTLQLDDRLRLRDDMTRALAAADAAMEASTPAESANLSAATKAWHAAHKLRDRARQP